MTTSFRDVSCRVCGQRITRDTDEDSLCMSCWTRSAYSRAPEQGGALLRPDDIRAVQHGTPAGVVAYIKAVGEAQETAAVAQSDHQPYHLVIFDVDGTLVQTCSGETFRALRACGEVDRHGHLYTAHTTAEEDWEWLPGRLNHLRELVLGDVRMAFATNQGGVAIGKLHEVSLVQTFVRMRAEVAADTGVPPEAAVHITYCTYLPGVSPEDPVAAYMRKPAPGMLEAACTFFNVASCDALMVGDRSEDEEAARNAGTAFQWASEYFGDR